jgi:hypothetical protein
MLTLYPGTGKRAESTRWVVNPWFVWIQSDHETLDIPESGSWSEVAAAHRDLTAIKGTLSGQINTHGLPPCSFPAAVSLRGISALSDALVGLRRWTDPQVRQDAEILLDADERRSWKFVEGCRSRMAAAFKKNMQLIRELEKECFGENSYYALKESGKYRFPKFEGDFSGDALEEEGDVEGKAQ